jgi:DNA polymerase III alpha subunit (gram-positive type)
MFCILFETSGLKSYVHAVCSAYIKKYNSTFAKDFMFYPTKSIYNIEALNVNHLTLEELYEKGSSRSEIINCINNMYEAIGKKQGYIILCAWNSEFDMSFLEQIYKEKKQKFPCPIVSFDLLQVAKDNIKKRDARKKEDDGVENHRLTTIYQHFFNDFEEEKAHTSEYDTLMVEKLYDKFKQLKWL